MIAATWGEPDVLLQQLDGHLARLRDIAGQTDRGIGAALRRLVAETASASAADRAQVRAAVHLYMLRRGRGGHWISEILTALGRQDLLVLTEPG